MRLEVRSAGQSGVARVADGAVYVRRPWAIVAAYEIAVSVLVGVGVAVVVWAMASAGAFQREGEHPLPAHEAFVISVGILALVAVVAVLAQLATGPFVFTRDAVCRDCHTRQRLRRRPFFAGRYSRAARCACGGRLEPTILWRHA